MGHDSSRDKINNQKLLLKNKVAFSAFSVCQMNSAQNNRYKSQEERACVQYGGKGKSYV